MNEAVLTGLFLLFAAGWVALVVTMLVRHRTRTGGYPQPESA